MNDQKFARSSNTKNTMQQNLRDCLQEFLSYNFIIYPEHPNVHGADLTTQARIVLYFSRSLLPTFEVENTRD